MNEAGCETFVSDCRIRTAAELIKHTWDPVVLSALRLGPTRRSVLLERIAGVSDKVLTGALRRLVLRGLVRKAADDMRRDAAVYELTELGTSFAEGPLLQLGRWAAENEAELSATC
ncbi:MULTISPECIES: helix-turn-helix domain-containing protein [unclassified Mycolicibacterium]|uniref:winged helix-turn-helix transcriptional regulator n=1 Tax=unclassified Mycolicibacterium TaxID=2636767 RepID=UPI001305E133|nr:MULTISPECIES: helix-turn-helix domain-containing protein [unclassified Mycolicibacterium]MUL83957.1 helix-turn-helix transcriptional regulator [Mycolicibacterium sp. CBMA 329]MUL89977.1 helix-turn-helix transcriptional regulator [Mycolicibacterium sp. CBMA 331]MUL98002.1 helix-turn-helix transcriptional regulator [Mycolicibacterium sp. CBMA 334]MUM27933.1 helix-turn-helix transcriptional regulator [Mycolicibacterium sp. CBMA 295]MUM39492.1 helix-turn-helix transcriptional regulator [Mycolic